MGRRGSAEIKEALERLGTARRRELLLDVVEAKHIRRVLAACNGSRTLAAALLGVPRRTLQRKLARLRK